MLQNCKSQAFGSMCNPSTGVHVKVNNHMTKSIITKKILTDSTNTNFIKYDVSGCVKTDTISIFIYNK